MTVARKKQRRNKIGHHPAVVREQIGRYSIGTLASARVANRAYYKTIDDTIPDYQFWDEFRNGKKAGFRLAAMLCRRAEHIFASWTLGQGVTVALEEPGDPANTADPRNYTDGLLSDFLDRNHALLLDVEQDKLGLGDQYIIVNMDGSLSVPSPDTVEVKRDPYDYRAILSYTITTILDEYTITDEYRLDGRTVTIKRGVVVESISQFQNLIGRLPVIHLANEMTGNEVYGRSLHSRLLAFYDNYDDVLYKQIDGARLLGNPMLLLKGLKDVVGAQNGNKPAQPNYYYDKDGNAATQEMINISTNGVILGGEGVDGEFLAPPVGFTTDTQQALKTLFMLAMYESLGIPELIWGNQLSGAHATADVQMTQWVRDIQARQKQDEGWLLELCEIWLATVAITDPGVVLDKLDAEWPELLDEDKKTLLEYINAAYDRGLLTDKTALELYALSDDPAKETTEAQAERQSRQDAMFPNGTSQDFQSRLNQDAAANNNGQPNGTVQQMDDEPTPIVHEYTFLLDTIRELRQVLMEVAA